MELSSSRGSADLLAGYLPEADVARALGLTPRTLRLWRQRREGPPHVRIGVSVFYPEDGLREWLKTLEVKPVRRRS